MRFSIPDVDAAIVDRLDWCMKHHATVQFLPEYTPQGTQRCRLLVPGDDRGIEADSFLAAVDRAVRQRRGLE